MIAKTILKGYIFISSKGETLFPVQLALKDNKTDKIISIITLSQLQYRELGKQAGMTIQGLQVEITREDKITIIKPKSIPPVSKWGKQNPKP